MTLLPSNATKYERALENTCARSFSLPVLINTLRNPAECPMQTLPWLAYEWSVDEWNEEWSEEQKRQTVARSIAVHKKKGTRGAVEDALGALGVEVTAREWWEEAPKKQAGTYSLEVKGALGSSEAFQEILTVVNSAKNTRSHLTAISVPQDVEGEVGIVAVAQLGLSASGGLPNDLAVDTAIVPVGGMGMTCTSVNGFLPTLQKYDADHTIAEIGVGQISVPCNVRPYCAAEVETETTYHFGGITQMYVPVIARVEGN